MGTLARQAINDATIPQELTREVVGCVVLEFPLGVFACGCMSFCEVVGH
jgi:hypothetical protein